MRTALLAALLGCAEVKSAAGAVGGTAVEYIVCPLELESVIECGHVFECTGGVELCIDDDDQPEQLDDINAMFGDCKPTSRHQGICSWQCDGGAGCNATHGCYGCAP